MNYGSLFFLGPQAIFTWSPGNNTFSGATLFTNGLENFNPTSTLIIKKWFDYLKPLGEVVTGNFGNIIINSPGGANSIVEWNQKNKFETHLIKGTLTIDEGWITLDKTGSISSTVIGNIALTSVNSTFIAHSGTHQSSFTLSTGSVTNNNGNFYGLHNGNGNIHLNISGNFYNSGNVKVINNSGELGVSNGNANFRVNGDFLQSNGDTRIIYNVTTTNSGNFNASFKNLIISGGVFIGQSACHTAGRLNLLNISQDLLINFNSPTDKFRGNGLTSIGQSINNAGLAINIGKDLTVSGITQAEFTTSASSGDELISVHRNMTIQGCTNNLNYGTPDASHSTELYVQGNLLINGGVSCFSKNNGRFHSVISNDLTIINGDLLIKGNSGPASFIINGEFNQSAGNFVFHSNTILKSNDIIKIQINGAFTHSGGTINFDDNVSGAEHILSISGDSFCLKGDGTITRSGSGNLNASGQINFEKIGLINYKRNGIDHTIDHVVQVINEQCELVVNNENIKLASFTSDSIFAFKILNGGKLTLNNSSLSSGDPFKKCIVRLDSSGIISITNANGFSGKTESALNSNVNFSLHEKSIVEYCGNKNQIVTGISSPQNQANNKYGILRINKTNPNYSALIDENVFIRTKLELIEGKIKLNNHILTIENGNKDAISRIKGFLDCNLDQSSPQNIISWNNMSLGIHVFPFGRSMSNYLPVIFNLKTGSGTNVTMSTCKPEFNNAINPFENKLTSTNTTTIESKAVERLWLISAPGTMADITFTYAFDETINDTKKTNSSLSVKVLNGLSWTSFQPSGSAGNKNNRTISLNNVVNGKQFVIVSKIETPNFDLKLFDVILKENEVLLSWETINESKITTYQVEKSLDNINFNEIGTLNKNSNYNSDNSSNYTFSDKELPVSISYYRLKYTYNNIVTHSKIKAVSSIDNYKTKQVKIYSINPNPFTSQVKIEFKVDDKSALIEIINAEGRTVYSIPLNANDTEEGFATLNLEHLKKGIYFLSISNNGIKDAVKIIKSE